MSEPLLALVSGVLLAGAITFLLWPGKGMLARILRRHRLSTRILREDILKFLYNAAGEGRSLTLHKLADSLNISEDRVAKLLSGMQERRLVRWQKETIELTDSGRTYALHVVRAHRLWEYHLADETGFTPTTWHQRADKQEHLLTSDDLDQLSARLGHPMYDPHGDPIPQPDGDLISQNGISLSAIDTGMCARIIHIEDEPPYIFEQIADAGLKPGMTLRVVSKEFDKIRFQAEGNEHTLPLDTAENIFVKALPNALRLREEAHLRLSGIKPGQCARVRGIARACHGPERRRLLDLGLVPGTIVEAAFASPGKDPIAYSIRGALIALRREQAEMIFVDSLSIDDVSTAECLTPEGHADH